VETFLIDEWIGAEDAVPVLDEASLSVVRARIRDVASAQGLGAVYAERLTIIGSELGRNQLRHARCGQIAVRAIARGGHQGVELVAADEGSGIDDPTSALEGRPRVEGSLGVGLASVRALAYETDVDIRLREGTCIRARVFDGQPPKRREVGVYGRPYRDEPRSGDHACFDRDGERLIVGVCDGLGHGDPARSAAGQAMHTFAQNRSRSPAAIVEACHRALGPTRGAVMAVLALGQDESKVELASVGNITIEVVQPRESRRFAGTSFVLGSRQRGWRAQQTNDAVSPEDAVLVYTDGVISRASIEGDLALLRQHPVVIAHQLVQRFGREDDDVLVLVAK
jgi:anti-sigma regulatory factor (Ser/Thr protein kinase)